MSASRCLIGVGRPHGDDQLGWLIADRLSNQDGHGTGKSGTWKRWTWPDVAIIQQRFAGSHDFGLTAVLNLAARLGRLPRTVMIWGVEVETCEPAAAMSSTALAVVEPVANAIMDELNNDCD